MSTIGNVSRDLSGGSHDQDHTPNDDGGLPLGYNGIFEPSLPPRLPTQQREGGVETPNKTPHGKRRRSFLTGRRHTDGRRGYKSIFSNPFLRDSSSRVSGLTRHDVAR